MSNALKIELTQQAKDVLAGLQNLPALIAASIALAMDEQNELTIGHIQQAHLTGRGPFPVAEHKLGVRTNRLRGSVRASAATVAGNKVDSAIGSNVIYAAIHEFGGRIHHPAREVKVRLHTDARGNLVRQLGNSNLARFAKSTHKRFKEITSQGKAYDVDMPERAPFRTGIDECAPHYGKSISAAIVGEWNRLGK
jgi:phage gpG-like protein